ncbi:hypothetical protein [Brumimicrobium mesophilum]|uniref:hypothetical protein n=1 Tax=Brumimicrobium mesophilum TaxID=392717 RepID=UPI000D141A2C|nr:hypothetical protein [Brumimicrobium mesophilum]
MKTIKLLSLGLLLSGGILFSSCKKEGCTNPVAENYDAKAKTSDKSCTYSVDVVFWFDEVTSQALMGSGIDKLKFYLNEENIGTSNTDIFWEEAPKCDEGGSIRFTKTLEKASFEPFYYYVTDADDEDQETIWSGITQLDTDSCRVIRLTDF